MHAADVLSLQKYGSPDLCLSVSHVLFFALENTGSQGGILLGGTGVGHLGVGTVWAMLSCAASGVLPPEGGTLNGRQVL
jgi:hypothetical protein|eukprot:COSAG01_NODE_1482_length_10160_cov_12.513567_3_plen_79_part_00